MMTSTAAPSAVLITSILIHCLFIINLFSLQNCLLTALLSRNGASRKKNGRGMQRFKMYVADPTNLYGPIKIMWANGKGRGLFLTEDVEEEQVILREQVFEYGFSSPPYKSLDILVLKLYNRVIIDGEFNALLATLTDGMRKMDLPKLEQLTVDASHAIALCPTLTIENIQGIVKLNSFNYYNSDPIAQLSSRSDSENEEVVEGSALWLVTSFMNHDSKDPNTYRRQDGKFNTLTAARKLPRGTELTTRYHHSSKALQQWGIFEP